MSTSGAQRLELYDRLKGSIGGETAAMLLDALPPMSPSEIATTSDVETLGRELRGEMTELRGELRGEMTELRAELRGEMTELRGEMTALRAELRGEMAELRGEFRSEFGELRAEFKASSRHTIVTIVAAAMTVWLSVYLPAVL